MFRNKIMGTYCSLMDRLWPILLSTISSNLSKKTRTMGIAGVSSIPSLALGAFLFGKEGFCVFNHRACRVLATTCRAEGITLSS